MDTLFIVMPAYNEEMNIRAVVEQWYPVLSCASKESRLVIADEGSKDRTHAILEEMRAEGFLQLEILANENQYHGPKLIALYKYAIREGADFIFQTDSDGQTNPGEFRAFWEERENYDGIFGNRTRRGDGKGRAFIEKVVCLLLRSCFGVRIPDANAPFRLLRADVLEKYIDRMPGDYNLPNIMISTFFVYYKERTAFREISFKSRRAGVNSVNLPRIIRIGWGALGDFRKFKQQMKDDKDERAGR
ncbi:MAG: glycosyltransferase family 2 protein [Lachnospiraceae bacterium]|nr:glycosyltransferase family 2 protein [Lachnospiraceae bacterium]